MASTLEMLIRAKYVSTGSGEIVSELQQIKTLLNTIGRTPPVDLASKVSATEFDVSKFLPDESDITSVERGISGLTTEIDQYKAAARAAYASGDTDASSYFQKSAKAVETKRAALQKLVPQVEETGDAIQSLLTNRITRLGFGLFAIQSTIQTFASLVGGMFDTLSEGAASLDRSRSFEILLRGEGIDSNAMANKLKSASQGLLTLDEAMTKTIQLTKAGFPEIAKNSDQLLRIATNAAIVSGDVGQAATVYDKLIRGIIRGSPRLIDDADIILKLGDANEQYAASIGKTVEQLTAADKVQATYNAVLEEGSRINTLADDMDSASVKVEKLRTNWEELVETMKESVAIALISDGDTEKIEAQAIAIASFAEATDEQSSQLVARFLSAKGAVIALVGGVGLLALLVKDIIVVFKSLAATVTAGFALQRMAATEFGYGLDFVAAKMKGLDGQADESMTKMKALQAEMSKTYSQTFGSEGTDDMFAQFDKNKAEWDSKMNDMMEAAGFITGKQRTGQAFDPGGDDEAQAEIEDNTEEMGKLLRERASMASDIAFERTQKVREIARDHADKMRDISRKLADKLEDIDRDLAQKMADLAQTRADKLADIARDLADKLLDIDTDLADKLSDVQSDAAEKRADAYEDYTQGIQDAEEDHQKKLNDIMRKYESSRMKALIDRDARALFEAQKAREEDLEDLEDNSEEKKQSELEKLQEKLEDINKAEEKARADAIKAAEKKRADAIKAAEEQRRDAQMAYDRARRDAQIAADRARRDARENAARERQEARAEQRKARQDLQSWYQERLRDLANFHQEELGAIGNHYGSINEMTGQFFGQQLDAWSAFGLSMGGNRIWEGIGGTTDPTTGEEFPDWHNPANVYAGGRCNRGSSQITTGADGRQYICTGNTWKLFTGVAGAAGISSVGGVGAMGGGDFVSATGGGTASPQRVKLVLEGNGDDALTNIIKSGAYEAFLEVIS